MPSMLLSLVKRSNKIRNPIASNSSHLIGQWACCEEIHRAVYHLGQSNSYGTVLLRK
jgi:hypothetical protein